MQRFVVLCLAGVFFACGSKTPSSQSTLASASPGIPVIPVDTAGFRGSSSGPAGAVIGWFSQLGYRDLRSHLDQLDFHLHYAGYLQCDFAGSTRVGIVQKGRLIMELPVYAQPLDRAGTPGNCGVQIPIAKISEGEIEFYFRKDDSYDSNYGQNFRFIVSFAAENVICFNTSDPSTGARSPAGCARDGYHQIYR